MRGHDSRRSGGFRQTVEVRNRDPVRTDRPWGLCRGGAPDTGPGSRRGAPGAGGTGPGPGAPATTQPGLVGEVGPSSCPLRGGGRCYLRRQRYLDGRGLVRRPRRLPLAVPGGGRTRRAPQTRRPRALGPWVRSVSTHTPAYANWDPDSTFPNWGRGVRLEAGYTLRKGPFDTVFLLKQLSRSGTKQSPLGPRPCRRQLPGRGLKRRLQYYFIIILCKCFCNLFLVPGRTDHLSILSTHRRIDFSSRTRYRGFSKSKSYILDQNLRLNGDHKTKRISL